MFLFTKNTIYNAYMYAYIHMFISTYIHTYIHMYMHTWIYMCIRQISGDSLIQIGIAHCLSDGNNLKRGVFVTLSPVRRLHRFPRSFGAQDRIFFSLETFGQELLTAFRAAKHRCVNMKRGSRAPQSDKDAKNAWEKERESVCAWERERERERDAPQKIGDPTLHKNVGRHNATPLQSE
jgi:hypothetical protein